MSRTRTLANMILDVRSRTNMETSTFVTDEEITEFLNQELAELWGHITQSSGAPHYRAVQGISVTVGTTLYPLPVTFWQCQGVEANVDGNQVRIRSFSPAAHAAQSRKSALPYWSSATRYRIQAGNIEFQPVEKPFMATLFFTPCCPRLTDPGDTFDGFNGWEVAAVYGASATVQLKEETDPGFYEGRKAAIYRQIDTLAAQRDAADPETVQDVTSCGFFEVYGGGWH